MVVMGMKRQEHATEMAKAESGRQYSVHRQEEEGNSENAH